MPPVRVAAQCLAWPSRSPPSTGHQARALPGHPATLETAGGARSRPEPLVAKSLLPPKWAACLCRLQVSTTSDELRPDRPRWRGVPIL